MFFALTQTLADFFNIAGVLILGWGGVLAVLWLVKTEVIHLGRERKHFIEDLRRNFAQKIILGLEFFIAGDAIRLIVNPTLEQVIILGSVAAIRTLLSYFLSREIKQ